MPDDRPEPFVERRKQPRGRRADDEAQAEILDHAVQDAPLVHRLLQTGKVAGAVGAICMVLGGLGAALGMRMVGPTATIAAEAQTRARGDSILGGRIDVNACTIQQLRRSTDSLVSIMSDMRADLRISAYSQCVMFRKYAPELRAPGCDAAEKRGGPNPSP